jgi:hypothetical protein
MTTNKRPITSEILARPDLTSLEKLLLIAIASHGQVAFPSQRRLATMTSLSIRTVKVLVGRLREKNVITTNWERKSLTYNLAIDGAPHAPVVQDMHLKVQHMHQSGGAGDAPVVQQMHRGGAGDAPQVVQDMHPNSYMNSKTNPTTRTQAAGVVDIKDAELRRLVMREPAWRTRIERAEAGDWLDEDKRPIEPAAILATAMNTVRERTLNERDTIIERVTAKGLSDGEAAQLWRAWFVEHMNGGPAPVNVMRNDLNDKSIRNHASVWRARLGGKYTPDHGEVTQGSGAAGGDG